MNGSGNLVFTITGTPTSSGVASFAVTFGGQSCSFIINVIQPVGSISTLNCAGAVISGILTDGINASNVTATINYTGGNTGYYASQTVNSTIGAGGTNTLNLTANLSSGSLNYGNGSLVYTISGIPAQAGAVTFPITLGGQTCTLNLTSLCNFAATTINDVTNPTTGRIWMDRNLGANNVALSSTSQNAYGDFFQWGRAADNHQCRTSPTTATLSSVDQPAHGNFILAANNPNDWRSPQNANLWQGVSGVNNPCPIGYRLPTETEINSERLSWTTSNSAGAFASVLKLVVAGDRDENNGGYNQNLTVGSEGGYWTSTVNGTESRAMEISSNSASFSSRNRASGFSVRCIKN